MRLTNNNGSYSELIFDNYKGVDCIGQRTVNNELTQKLSKLENIEEELGIDLITLFNALKNGIWVNETSGFRDDLAGIHFIKGDDLKTEIDCGEILIIVLKELYYEDLDNVMAETGHEWFIDEYGKTWALTKEELENV